jgi:hypothetical protein
MSETIETTEQNPNGDFKVQLGNPNHSEGFLSQKERVEKIPSNTKIHTEGT